MPPSDDAFKRFTEHDAGVRASRSGGDAAWLYPAADALLAARGENTMRYGMDGAEGIAIYREPSLLLLPGKGWQRPISVSPGGMGQGRHDQLGLPFSADERVSCEHVSLRRCDDGLVEIADLGPADGTYVNGKQIRAPVRMEALDVLRIGRIELGLELDRDTAVSRQDTVIGAKMKASPENRTLKWQPMRIAIAGERKRIQGADYCNVPK